MNKLIKGAVAAAAGTVLLLGGASTLAFWNAEAGLDGVGVTAGTLEVASTADGGTWTANGSSVSDIDAYRIVPGDVLTYTKTFDVVATGDNLVAALDLAEGSIAPATASDPEDVALSSALEASATLTASGTGIVAGTGNSYTVTAGTAGVSQEVTVVVTITFPEGAAGDDNGAMTGSVSLGDMAVTLTQTLS